MSELCPRCGMPLADPAHEVTPGGCRFRWNFQPRCRGCGEAIADGQVALVTVTRGRHVITVNSHEHHREASRAAALEDLSWQRDQSHYGGGIVRIPGKKPRPAPQRGKGRKMGPRDIPKHTCVREEERTRTRAANAKERENGITRVKTTFWRCRTCHVSMGETSEYLHY